MEIKILGPGCAKCEKTEKLLRDYVTKNKIDATVEKVSDLMQIAGFGVFSTPAVVVDGEVKISGRVPKEKEIKDWLEK
ncbi:MAG: TM0996/MTH895 family glutaredoxin-like protein [Proteobacteria bacterium]|nr:TM0996/MTH895 family glutaredoxin-like protein [Pseudomonadota bacterium]